LLREERENMKKGEERKSERERRIMERVNGMKERTKSKKGG